MMAPERISEKLTDVLADVDALWCDVAADDDASLLNQISTISDRLLELKIEIERGAK
jgi:hypothetical protein